MLRKSFNDLPELQHWGYKPYEFKLGTIKSLDQVRLGQLTSLKYKTALRTCLAASHILTDVTPQDLQGAAWYVTDAALEQVNHQYLLCGLSDGGLAIYDTSMVKKGHVFQQEALLMGGRRGTHKHQVDCVQWYPADTGLFSTSSKDKQVKLWDPTTMKVVDQYSLECHVLHHSMSPVATKHALLSVAAENGEIILCDLRCGSSSHRLQGHDGPVQVVQWSPRNQHVLVSGGRDHMVKVWDVRSTRAHLMALDKDSSSSAQVTSKYRKKLKKTPVAHNSRVTSMCFTADGLWLLTFSYGGDLKLWNSATGENMNVDYGETRTDIKKNMSMAVTVGTYPDLIFLPSKAKIHVHEVFSGRLVNSLEEHFSSVLGVVHNPSTLHLYSYGFDRNFASWMPKKWTKEIPLDADGNEEEVTRTPDSSMEPAMLPIPLTQDAWSSDED